MRPDHPTNRLPELVQQVRDHLAAGAVIDGSPLPASYRDAVAYMVYRLYLRSSRYRMQWHAADEALHDADVAEFVTAFRRFCERMGVPVHAELAYGTRRDQVRRYVKGEWPHLPGRCVALIHSVRGRDLPPKCWDVLSHAGHEVAAKLGLKVEWGGHGAPWQWVCVMP